MVSQVKDHTYRYDHTSLAIKIAWIWTREAQKDASPLESCQAWSMEHICATQVIVYTNTNKPAYVVPTTIRVFRVTCRDNERKSSIHMHQEGSNRTLQTQWRDRATD
jgi:hypothetical protein